MRRLIPLAICAPALLGAQTMRVTGIAFDSLSNRPLPAAFVSIGTRSAFTDSAGHFVIDSIAPGTYRATLQHDRLDSLGLTGIAASVVVRGPSDTIRIATPSARTMWRRVCPGEAPVDSGFVFGAVRTAVGAEPVKRTAIVASWIDLSGGGSSINQKEWRLESATNDEGAYVMCGLPLNAYVRLSATRDSVVTNVDLSLSRTAPVRRRDVTLVDFRVHGVVRGVITLRGTPLANVRVSVAGGPEVRTPNNGRFMIRDVPAGTQVVDIQGIGFAPVSQSLDVPANDTVDVSIAVERITVLDSVVVRAPTYALRLQKEFEDRRHHAIAGYFRDSSDLGKKVALESVFEGMGSINLRRPQGGGDPIISTASITRGQQSIISRAGGEAACRIYVDGTPSLGRFGGLRPDEIAALEVYKPGDMPRDLMGQLSITAVKSPCAVVVWTRNRFRP